MFLQGISQKTRTKLVVFSFIFPMFVCYTVFLIMPAIASIILSFTEWKGINLSQIKFIGLNNYGELFKDPIFWIALRNTLLFVMFALTVQYALAFILAILLQQDNRISGFFRAVFFAPQVLSLIIVGLLFVFFLSPSMGLVTLFLEKIGVRFAKPLLADKRLAIYILTLVRTWREFGFSMFLLIAGLQAIPQSIYEAAEIDGARSLQRLWFVTIPLLKEVSVVVMILAGTAAFRVFELVYIISAGGPFHATEVAVTYTYQRAFVGSRMGYGSSIATTLAAMMFIFTFLFLYLSKAGTRRY